MRNSTSPTDVKSYVRGSSSWSAATAFIDGDMVVSGTIGASQITAGSISANRLVIGNTTTADNSRLKLLDDKIEIYDGTTLRIKIGNLA